MSGTNLLRRILWLLAVIVLIVLLDQLIKRAIVDWIGPGAESQRWELLGNILAFEYLENRGAAFGLFQQGTAVLTVVSIVIIAVALVGLVRAAISSLWLALGISLIIGGAIGNLIDRIVRGFVVDYIAIGNFWKFNLADAAVSVGAVLTFILLWRADSVNEYSQDKQVPSL